MLLFIFIIGQLHAFVWNKPYSMSFIFSEYAVPVQSKSDEFSWSELSQYIRQEKFKSSQKGERLFYLHLGSINDGAIVSDLLGYKPDFLSLKAMKVDALGMGKKDFNLFEKELKEEQLWASEKFITSNLIRKRTNVEKALFPQENLFLPFGKLEFYDLNLGFFNFLGENLRGDKVFREAHLLWEEPNKEYLKLKENLGTRFDIELIRLSESQLKEKSIDWTKTLVIGTQGPNNKLKHLIMAPRDGQELVRVDIKFINGVISQKKVSLISKEMVKASGHDQKVKKMLDKYIKRSEIILNEKLGVLEKDYQFQFNPQNLDKNFWGYTILKSYTKFFKADVAFMDYGNLKKFPEKGPLYYRDILSSYGEYQELCEVEILGRELQDYLSYMTYKFPFEKGQKPVGIGYKFAQGDGEENYLLVGDKFLRQQSKYKMVVPRKLLLGGESYPNLSLKNKYECSSLKEHHVFSHYVKGVKTL